MMAAIGGTLQAPISGMHGQGPTHSVGPVNYVLGTFEFCEDMLQRESDKVC